MFRTLHPRPDARTLWLIDLDDTLHHATPHIFARMNRAMTDYVMSHLGLDEARANALREEYWQRYGATLLGLMKRHAVDPDHFLDATHQFPDLAELIAFDRRLRAWLTRLPGRKVLVSNAPRAYVHAVLATLGIAQHFEAVETIESMRYVPKPAASSLARILKRHRRAASKMWMLEDNLHNLRTARRLRLRTVWISPRAGGRPAFVDVKVQSITQLK
jgi:putative hydrolase of the HAD superfamily